jgi:hypothetical protein
MIEMLFALFVSPPRAPRAPVEDDDSLHDYGLLARNLSNLLARCSETGRRRQFPQAQAVHRRIQLALGTGLSVHVPAMLLSDALHEIAQFVDADTRAAARRCMLRQLPVRVGQA